MGESRVEDILENILGGSNPLGEPQSRMEAILGNMLGQQNPIGEPQSRVEDLLIQILEQGGGSETLDKLIEGSEVDIVSNASQIRPYAFMRADKLKTAKFPEATTIGGSAFSNCSSLTTIDFSKLTEISSSPFSACTNFEIMIFRSNFVVNLSSPSFNVGKFSRNSSGGKLYVPENLVNSYKNDMIWGQNVFGTNTNNECLPIEGSIYE